MIWRLFSTSLLFLLLVSLAVARPIQLAQAERWMIMGPSPTPTASPTPSPTPSPSPTPLPSVRLVETDPSFGEQGVSLQRETVLRFSGPIVGDTVPQAVSVSFGTETLNYRPELSPDGETLTLFYPQRLPESKPLPDSARIRVRIDGDQLVSHDYGTPVDADGDGFPGGVAILEFDTASLTTFPGTAVVGRVMASEQEIAKNGHGKITVDRPLSGVRIFVQASGEAGQEIETFTDTFGNFRLEPAPASDFFVYIDGRTVKFTPEGDPTTFPDGPYYPFVGKLWPSEPGVETNIGDIFLPLVPEGALETVSTTEPTEVTFTQELIDEDPRLEDISITVPPNALYDDRGQRGGRVGIAPVQPDRLPEPLPPGLEFPLVITVQTNGPANFSEPVPVCFPNLPDPDTGYLKQPGEKSALWSFDHDTGDWVLAGPMTVNEDGTLVCSDPGIGILEPGWHGERDGTEADGPQCPGGPNCCPSGECCDSDAECCDQASEACCDSPNVQDDRIEERANRAKACLAEARGLAAELLPALRGFTRTTADLLDDIISNRDNEDCVAVLTVINTARLTLDSLNAGKETANVKLNAIIASLACGVTLLDLIENECAPIFNEPFCYSFHQVFGCSLVTGLRLTLNLAREGLSLVRTALDFFGGKLNAASVALSELRAEVDRQCAEKDRLESKNLDPYWDALVAELEDLSDLAKETDELFESEVPLDDIDSHTMQFSRPTSIYSVVEDGRRPSSFLKVLILEEGGLRELRQVADDLGNYGFVLPSRTQFIVSGYDHSENECGYFFGETNNPGVSFELQGPAYGPCDPVDADGDALTDEAESIIGTSPTNPDTDGDGIPDGAELDQGLDPLDGIPARTGIIGTVDTPGIAQDIYAEDNLLLVAGGDEGVTVFNAFNGLEPRRMAQVDTSGSARAVARSGEFVAVADDFAGLAIIDITDPPAAEIVRQVGRNALGGSNVRAVEAAGPFAFAGSAEAMVQFPRGFSSGFVYGQW